MQSVDGFLVSQRLDDLHREAQEERLAVASRRARPLGAAPWRRHAGAAARWLSRSADTVALALDPSLCRPSYGRE
jgi:hypothetical protein